MFAPEVRGCLYIFLRKSEINVAGVVYTIMIAMNEVAVAACYSYMLCSIYISIQPAVGNTKATLRASQSAKLKH